MVVDVREYAEGLDCAPLGDSDRPVVMGHLERG